MGNQVLKKYKWSIEYKKLPINLTPGLYFSLQIPITTLMNFEEN